jgi:AcrR family transcriptional regulator
VSSTRVRLLDVTRRLVSERGAGVSMADVAAAAGLSRQAVYLHFGSRAGLFVAVVRHMDEVAGIRQQCERALDHADPVQALRDFLVAWLRYAATIAPMATALLASRRADGDVAAAWSDRMGELRTGFLVAAQRLADAGWLRPGLGVAAAADLAWALTSVPVWDQLTVDRGWPAAEVEGQLVEAVTLALTRDRGDAPPSDGRRSVEPLT